MTGIFYEIGPLKIELRGHGPIHAAVRCELAPMISKVGGADIVFDFTAVDGQAADGVISELITTDGSGFHAQHSGLRYRFERASTGTYLITVNPTGTYAGLWERMAARGYRLLNWNYLSPAETIAKNFIYDLFDYSTQLALLEKGATYIHASAVAKDGQAVLLAGRGGVGKSAFMLKSVLEQGWCYLSDDLAVIDADAVIWRTPKKMQIYGYNTVEEPVVRERLLAGRSILDLAAWHARFLLKGGKRVRRRTAADDLFGASHTSKSAPLVRAIFLERHRSAEVAVKAMSVDEFAYRCATVLVGELSPYSEIAIAEHSANSTPLLPAVAELHDRTYQILRNALESQRPLLVQAPASMSPAGLSACLSSVLRQRQDHEPEGYRIRSGKP